MCDLQHTDSLPKPDTRDILLFSRTHLRFTAGVLSSSSPSLDSTDTLPPCAPEVVLKSPPVWEEKAGSVSVNWTVLPLGSMLRVATNCYLWHMNTIYNRPHFAQS